MAFPNTISRAATVRGPRVELPVRARGDATAGGAALAVGPSTVNGVLADRPLVPRTTIVCKPTVAPGGIRTVTEKVPAAVAVNRATSTGALLKVAVMESLGANPLPVSVVC